MSVTHLEILVEELSMEAFFMAFRDAIAEVIAEGSVRP